jgi:uncharacterized protein YbjT (DUF2867 family)
MTTPSSPSPTAFIAGATGYTGREVVRALRARGLRVVAHVRPDSPLLDDWRARFAEQGAEVDATPWDGPAMTATLQKLRPDLVFALLGTTRARAKEAEQRNEDASRQSYEAVDYGLSAILLAASVAAGSRPRFVYLSSVGVTDDARGAYFQVRARLERELRESGLPYTIAQPSFITGEGERDKPRPFERIGAGMADAILGAAALVGARGLRDRYASIDPRVLAEGMVRAALDPAGENQVLETGALRG